MAEQQRQRARAVVCQETGKLLARANEHGLYLFCKLCHAEHFYAWADLLHVEQTPTPR